MMSSNYFVYADTRTFADIFPSVEEFQDEIILSQIPINLRDENVNLLYYLLYARYGNANIASSDENRFKYSVFSLIFRYGPTWEKRLDIQEKLRNLDENELLIGSKQIANQAFNPSTEPGTGSLEELELINQQQTNTRKMSKMEGYTMLSSLLETDVTSYMIDQFADLFIKVLAPFEPLLYCEE